MVVSLLSATLMSQSGRTVQGRVEDSGGLPLHEVTVQVMVQGEFRVLARTMTNHEGRFFFSQLPRGELEIVARRPGFEPASVSLSAGSAPAELVLTLVRVLPEIATDVAVFGAIPRTAASSSQFRRQEFSRRVLRDTADLLQVISGLTVVQHAGGGKANQYLIRGFDADHGTDFAVSFAGIPVNLVSHAHGQGYTDLNFVIPETLETIDVYKGPYFAELGNLATAGAAILRLRESVERPFLKVEGGQFGTRRVVAGWSPREGRNSGFVAWEGRHRDGPFRDPQDFTRLNLATRWSLPLPSNQVFSLLGTAYQGRWNQSGQIPLREVRAGRLDRFASLDPSEGGRSSRYNFSLSHQKVWAEQALNSQFYAVHSDLTLFSNFTFFAQDPLQGDGIRQADRRGILGGHLQYHHHSHWGKLPSLLTAGLDYRQDRAQVGLSRQGKRQVWASLLRSDLDERNLGVYLQQELELHPSLKTILGLRHDRFRFHVEDLEGGSLEGTEHRSFTGPKLSLIYSPREKGPHFYLNYGRGFHSNDARSVVTAPSAVALAGADGYEVGYRQIFAGRLELAAAYWLLDLEGELVFAGDEGTTELRGPTRRHGPEVEAKWKLTDFLWIDTEASFSRGFFRGSREAIPRAPQRVISGGLSFVSPKGLAGNLRLHHLGDHPLVEDRSVQAEGYTVADLYLQSSFGERWQLFLAVENLFNARYKEAQTFFESRLPWEELPVGDTHFIPGNPFNLQLGLQYRFP